LRITSSTQSATDTFCKYLHVKEIKNYLVSQDSNNIAIRI